MSSKMVQIVKLFLIAVCACLLLIQAGSSVLPAPVMAATEQAPTAVFTCTPATVGTFTDRVHVRCNPVATGGIAYFAYCSTTDPLTANRFLSIFTTAKVTGKTVEIYYTPSDTSGTKCGCSSDNCRVLWGAEVNP